MTMLPVVFSMSKSMSLSPPGRGVGESVHSLSEVGSNSTSIDTMGFGRSREGGS